MTDETPKAFWAGAGMVWRRQRVLWLLFFVTLLLSFLASRGVASSVSGVLNHSAYTEPNLVHGFNAAAVGDLALMSTAPLRGVATALAMPPLLFAVFMLFATGGILAVYTRNARLTAGPFFEACGEHFWRFVRLEIYFVLALIPVGILFALARAAYGAADARSVSPYATGHYLGRAIAAVIVLLALLVVRLWFDMAQVIAVSDGETAMHRALRKGARVVFRNFASLFGLFFGVNLIAGAGFGLGLFIWMGWLPPEATGKAALLAQALILFWIAMRLWERASEAIWYHQYCQMHARVVASVVEPSMPPLVAPQTAAPAV
ncbi:MAG: hypothetical protein WBF14_01455 [Candidatus Acidiferrales bacterium]